MNTRTQRTLFLAAAVFLFFSIDACSGENGDGSAPGENRSDDEASGLVMEKQVSDQASFVLYAPEGWRIIEECLAGFRTVSAAAPDGSCRAVASCGIDLSGGDPSAVAGFFIRDLVRQFPDLKLDETMQAKEKRRIVCNGTYTAPDGKREFRLWATCGKGEFVCSRIEAREGTLEKKRALLLTALANIRITNGAFQWKGKPPIVVKLAPHRLSDGSASFLLPRQWKVQELGKGNFIATDPAGLFSFIVASVDFLTPRMGTNVPGVPVSAFLRPHQALKFLVAHQRIATNMKFSEIVPREDLAGEIRKVYTLGPVHVEDFLYTCTAQGRPCKGLTLGICFGSRLDTNWNFRHLTVAGPEDRFDLFLHNFIAMLASYSIDDVWARNYVARGRERLEKMQRQTSLMVARNASEIRETMQQAFEERQASLDYIDYQRSNYIRGQSDWISEVEGGAIYHSDSWGTENKVTGEFWEGRPYDYVHFTGKNPKYREQMTPVDSRALWEKYVR